MLGCKCELGDLKIKNNSLCEGTKILSYVNVNVHRNKTFSPIEIKKDKQKFIVIGCIDRKRPNTKRFSFIFHTRETRTSNSFDCIIYLYTHINNNNEARVVNGY